MSPFLYLNVLFSYLKIVRKKLHLYLEKQVEAVSALQYGYIIHNYLNITEGVIVKKFIILKIIIIFDYSENNSEVVSKLNRCLAQHKDLSL